MKSLQLVWRPVSSQNYINVNCSRPYICLLRPQFAMSFSRAIDQFSRLRRSYSIARAKSDPRKFYAKNYDRINSDQLCEEETIPEYDPTHYYPAQLGEIFKERFQILSKLGFGSSSTIWLARDLW